MYTNCFNRHFLYEPELASFPWILFHVFLKRDIWDYCQRLEVLAVIERTVSKH